jgi:exonuclease SbcC
MPRNLTIDSITIDGLRGFNNTQTIELNSLHALIAGKMGAGKSSTLCAIEWALFGDIAHIKCSESKTQAEFVNVNKADKKARVTLKLKGDEGEYVVEREKYANERDSELTFSSPAGKFEGDEAANQIRSTFGTFEDFHRSVFLHQEAVRAILTEDIEKRDSALDRLFGLERTRELMSAIPVTDVKKEYEELEHKKTKIEERIKGAIKQAEKEMKDARAEALELGLKGDDFSHQVCIKKFKGITKSVLDASEDCSVEKPSFLEPANEKDVSKGLKKVKEAIKSCRMQIASTSKLTGLQQSWKQIDGAREKLEKALGELKSANDELKRMEKDWGTIEQIEKREVESKLEDKKLKNQRDTLDNTSKLVTDAIAVLAKQEIENCPVCDAKISNRKEVISKLQAKVSKDFERTISEIDTRRDKIREEMLELTEHKKAISKAVETIGGHKTSTAKAEDELRNILPSKAEGEVLLTEAKERLVELDGEIAKADKALTKKNEILQAIEDSAEMCRAIVRVLEKEAEYDKIKETFAEEGSQIKILGAQIEEMSALHARLLRISEAIAKTQINLAQEFIGKGETKISNYYDRLCGHPYYNSIRVDIDQRNVRGVLKNTYNIKAFNNREGKETLITTRFSNGQMNCAALSIFLSLSSILERKIGFIILDDPSQSLDTDHKKTLVKVLEDVALKNQLIIATQDAELEDEIDTGFAPKGGYVVLKYESWNKAGPVIKATKKSKTR